jgi:hypothetical protein
MIRLSASAASAAADAVCKRLDGGTLVIYEGQRPRRVSDELGSQRPLAAATLGTPAFMSAVDGAAKAYPLQPTTVLRDGLPGWYRVYDAQRAVAWDGTVGLRSGDCQLSSVDFKAGAALVIGSLVYRQRTE